MSDLLAARLQMAVTLAFHMFFAVSGIGMPLLMVIAEGMWLRTRDEVYLTLAKRWAKGTAILFAVGAVSGTVLSFELGLLWPGFMHFAGPIIGLPFSLEGFAFFTEAIFLGIYLYGWHRVAPHIHWLAGIAVALSGALSGIFVVSANAWMNNPTGFVLVDGKPTEIDPVAGMFNPAMFQQTLHMTLAAYLAAGGAAAAIHAFMLLRDKENLFHRRALAIALIVVGITAILQPISGDISAKHIAKAQPAKLAALEGQFQTETGAPLRIGGIPDLEKQETRFALEIPYLLSILAFNDPHAEVIGLEAFPRDEWPNPVLVHLAFQLMVGGGMALLVVSIWGGIAAWRKRALPDSKAFLWAVVIAGPLGMLAMQTGWIVTEVGRQPWIIYQVMRTADALTPQEGIVIWLITFSLLYLFLSIFVVWLFWRQVWSSPQLPYAYCEPNKNHHAEEGDDHV